MHILAVDDDKIMLDLLVDMLQALNFPDVETATSAEEALVITKMADKPFDCFLLDIQMPGGNGVQLCSDLRTMEAHKATPIIMLTAMTDRRYIDDAFVAGASDYVNKPFDLENLETRLHAALSQVRRHRDKQIPVPQLLHPDSGLFSVFDNKGFLELLDVPGMVSNRALNLYLDKLNQVGLYRSSAFAIRLNIKSWIDFDSAMNSLPNLVLEVAELLSRSLSQTSYVMSYVGSGTFVIITRRADPIYSPQWKSRLRAKFARRAEKYKELGRPKPELNIGPMYSQGGLIDRAPMLLVERAIQHIEDTRNRSGASGVSVLGQINQGGEVPRAGSRP